MSIEKRIFERLFKEDKTELATQKIDLSLVDDVKKENGRLIGFFDSAVNDYKDVADQFQRIASGYSKNSEKIADAIKKAKELGADNIEKQLVQTKQIADKYEAESKARAKKLYSL